MIDRLFFLPMDTPALPGTAARWYPEVWATPHAVDGISKEHLRPPSLLLGLLGLLLVLERPSSINSQGHRAVIFAGRVPDLHVVKFVDQSLLEIAAVEREDLVVGLTSIAVSYTHLTLPTKA